MISLSVFNTFNSTFHLLQRTLHIVRWKFSSWIYLLCVCLFNFSFVPFYFSSLLNTRHFTWSLIVFANDSTNVINISFCIKFTCVLFSQRYFLFSHHYKIPVCSILPFDFLFLCEYLPKLKSICLFYCVY